MGSIVDCLRSTGDNICKAGACVVNTTAKTSYYTVDAASKIVSDQYAMMNVMQIIQSLFQLNFFSVSQYVNNGLRFATDIVKSTYSINKVIDLTSGKAIGTNPEKPNDNRAKIEIDGEFIPNIIKLAGTLSWLVADTIKTLKTLEDCGVFTLSNIAAKIGGVSVYGYSLGFVQNLDSDFIRGRFGVVGFILDLADAGRDIFQNDWSTKTTGRILKDISKLVTIVLRIASNTMPQFKVWGWVAYGVGSAIYLVFFLVEKYTAKPEQAVAAAANGGPVVVVRVERDRRPSVSDNPV